MFTKDSVLFTISHPVNRLKLLRKSKKSRYRTARIKVYEREKQIRGALLSTEVYTKPGRNVTENTLIQP